MNNQFCPQNNYCLMMEANAVIGIMQCEKTISFVTG